MAVPFFLDVQHAGGQCVCKEGANEFVRRYFCDCIYTTTDSIAFSCGIISIGFWLFAQLPQLVENYRNKKVEALSAWFLVDWLMGDTCNLVGCLATGNQLATQVYTAGYYVIMDVVLLFQYLYYSAFAAARHKRRLQQQANWDSGDRHSAERGRYEPLPGEEAVQGAQGSADGPSAENRDSGQSSAGARARSALVSCGGLILTGAILHRAVGMMPVQQPTHLRRNLLGHSRPAWVVEAGQIIGYVGSVLYVKGRLFQIAQNFIRKSAEGLSALMFINAICANLTYALAILLRLTDMKDFVSKLPWLIGSLGVVGLDAIIVLQEYASRMHLERAQQQ